MTIMIQIACHLCEKYCQNQMKKGTCSTTTQNAFRRERKKGKQTEKQLNQSSHSQNTDYKLFARMENSCLSLANFK